MPRLLITLCGLCLFGAANLAVADDSAELAARVKRLVRQLDDGLAKRVAAEEELLSLGPKILDLLPADSSRLSNQQKSTLRKVRSKLQVAAAQATTTASMITLEGEMTFADALAAIERQTGNKIGGFRERDVTVKVAFDKAPFWQAFDELLDQAKLDLTARDEMGLAISARPAEQRPRVGAASYDGVFRFEPLQINAVRSLRTPDVNRLQLTLQISWEPRASVISLRLPGSEIEATDDKGESLTVEGRRSSLGAEVDGLNMIDLTLPLRLPGRDVKQIKTLRGQIEATVLGRNQKFTFDRLSETKDEEQSSAGATVTFQQMRKNQQLYEVRMRVRFDDAADSLASHRDWISRNKAYIVDAAGKPIQPAAEESFLQGEDQVGRAYFFDLEKGTEGCRFVYETPGAVVRKSFQFEFKDIDLP
jgi:hypothetical protein